MKPTALISKNLQLNYNNYSNNYSKNKGDSKALNGLSLTVPEGGITAILGSNGAGKTTFIKCALGLLQTNSGSLQVLGQPAGGKRLKQHVGAMMQGADLPDLLSAREHLTLVCSYYQNASPIAQLIEQCGLSDFVDKRYKTLSDGQKRRVQFAAAIAGRPKLIFLDEPTTGLDLKARQILWNTIRNLSQNGSTVILTTHYLADADALADHTIVINKGKTIAQGTTDNVRNIASGTVIRCQTYISQRTIKSLPTVKSVNTSGRLIDILCNDSNTTLKMLLELDPHLSDLTVSTPSLDQAFEQLLNNCSTTQGLTQ